MSSEYKKQLASVKNVSCKCMYSIYVYVYVNAIRRRLKNVGWERYRYPWWHHTGPVSRTLCFGSFCKAYVHVSIQKEVCNLQITKKNILLIPLYYSWEVVFFCFFLGYKWNTHSAYKQLHSFLLLFRSVFVSHQTSKSQLI